MKYKIQNIYIKKNKIIIENETDHDCLCRVDINHKLFKILYLEPNSTIDFLFDKEEPINHISIREIK